MTALRVARVRLLLLALLSSFPRLSSPSVLILKSTLATDAKSPTGHATADVSPRQREGVDVTDLTVCVRFRLERLSRHRESHARIFLIGDPRRDDESQDFSDIFRLTWLDARYPYNFLGFGDHRSNNSWSSYALKIPSSGRYDIYHPKRWSHFCMAYNKAKSHILLVVDGSPLNVNFVDPLLSSVRLDPDFLTKIHIGGCPDGRVGCTIAGGMITDFNLWGTALSQGTLEEWTSCKSNKKGDLITWGITKWDMHNMLLEEDDSLETEDLCRPAGETLVLFPKPLNFSAATTTCQRMRGSLAVTDSEQKLQHQINVTKEHNNGNLANFWSGWSDLDKEGDFTRADTGESLSNVTNFSPPWDPGEPNGDNLENCILVSASKKGHWNDNACSKEYWYFCKGKERTIFRLRGLCPDSTLDQVFTMNHEATFGYYPFLGFSDSRMEHDSSDGSDDLWTLTSLTDSTFTSGEARVFGDYPIGTHWWTLHNYTCGKGRGENKKTELIQLNLNACLDEEFNCGDGTCVDIGARCDGVFDCWDQSDETNCTTVRSDATYLKDVPAPPNPDSSSNLTLVEVGADIYTVLEIDEVKSLMSLQFSLSLAWRDPRLTFENLREMEWQNMLTEREKELIWSPRVVFHNTKRKEYSVLDKRAEVTILRDKDAVPRPSSMQDLHNVHIYKGSENRMKITRSYTQDTICIFDLASYPFDTQECSLRLQAQFSQAHFIRLRPKFLGFLGDKEGIQYSIIDFSISEDSEAVDSTAHGVSFELVLQRRLLSVLLTNHIPTFLICLVSFSTNYYKPEYFEAIVTVNLTSLLVLTTLFINVLGELPKTSYIKMIDIWLMANLCVPFVETLLHTALDNLRGYEETLQKVGTAKAAGARSDAASSTKKKRQRYLLLHRVVTVGVPATYAAFILVYFFVGLGMRNKNN